MKFIATPKRIWGDTPMKDPVKFDARDIDEAVMIVQTRMDMSYEWTVTGEWA